MEKGIKEFLHQLSAIRHFTKSNSKFTLYSWHDCLVFCRKTFFAHFAANSDAFLSLVGIQSVLHVVFLLSFLFLLSLKLVRQPTIDFWCHSHTHTLTHTRIMKTAFPPPLPPPVLSWPGPFQADPILFASSLLSVRPTNHNQKIECPVFR